MYFNLNLHFYLDDYPSEFASSLPKVCLMIHP
jgi:hypothetical protein